jgi:hypothetical protein
MPRADLQTAFAASWFLLLSSVFDVLCKAVVQVRSHGVHDTKPFWKPFFVTAVLFLGMCGAWLFALGSLPARRRSLHRDDDLSDDADNDGVDEESSESTDDTPMSTWLLQGLLDVLSRVLWVQTLCWIPAALAALLHCVIELYSSVIGTLRS